MNTDQRGVVKLDSTENVRFKGSKDRRTVEAKIDSGAARTSIDHKLAGKIGAGPVVSSVVVNGEDRRPVAKAVVQVKGFEEEIEVSLSDRSNQSTQAIIGRDVLSYEGVEVDITG